MSKSMYKDCEIGSIPTNWNIQKLEELANVTGGKRLPKGSSLSEINNGHPYIRVSDMNDKGIQLDSMLYVPDDVVEQISRYRVDKDDLYISVAGTLGLVGKVPDELNGANLTENADRISNIRCNTDFLLYCLKSDFIKKIINSEMTTNAQPKLALTRIKQFPIPVPPLKEQQKIVEILSSVDAAIKKTEQVIAKTEEIKKGLMQQLLTKGIGHTEFKQTELGEIPVEWEVKKIKEICEVVSGGTPKTSVAEYWDSEDVVWITPTDITSHSGKYIADSSRKISKKGLEESSANLLPIGSVLMCSRATISPRAINTVPVSTNQGFKSFICSSAINNQFLYYLIDVLKEFFIKNASGSTFLEVSKSTVENCLIALPSIDEQMRIVDILSNIDYKSTNEQEKLLKLNYMKQGLMQQLLTGQVRVKVD